MRVAISGAMLLAVVLPGVVVAGARDGRLDLYWIDVEGGASTLIVTPLGESVLIDTGNPGFRDSQRIARVATEVAGIRRIDHLIITHYHGDHFGGASALSKFLPIGTVYHNVTFEVMPNDPGKDYLGFKCDRRTVIQPGEMVSLRKPENANDLAVSLKCLGTRQKFIAPADGTADNAALCADARMKDRDGSDNANSVVMLLAFGPFRFFDAGDLTWNREHDLICPKNLVGEVDVYQVTHHGLDSSNNPLVLRALRPTVAVMNNGFQKGCLPEVFATLKDTSSLLGIYQVHKNLRPDGQTNNVSDEFIANKENDKQCKGNHIELSVEPRGRSYYVRIPATGHERTYATRVSAP
jgi:beta-lactamase superfamily II metal-dependent hydrolase